MRRTATRRITTRHVLSHQAGLPLVDQELTVEDHLAGRLEPALERQEPYWEPGTKHGYHAIIYGTLLDGVLRRALGTSVAEYIQAHIRQPLSLDLALGVPPPDTHAVLPLRTPPPMRTPLQSARPGLLFDAVGLGLLDDPSAFNQPDVRAAPWPATNLVASARDLARLYAASVGPVDGVRLLDAESSAALARTRSIGPDEVLGEPSHFGYALLSCPRAIVHRHVDHRLAGALHSPRPGEAVRSDPIYAGVQRPVRRSQRGLGRSGSP
ncbi:esterase [Streptomyces lincolnensis]|uniref:Esterase n=1 Tax=Streptomyces lincolnensis TaxID=1915 RepID=A0A1B1M2G1_STRLN|nr:esterase [Streptomyces lincolnensis]AXG51760.1 esterase [Streptomyces lincolnensis]